MPMCIFLARRTMLTFLNLLLPCRMQKMTKKSKILMIFHTGSSVKFLGVRMANEILMYFRTLRKQSQEVSLSEPIDNDSDGNAISLLDVISCEDTMLEQVELSDRQQLLYRYLTSALDGREREILLLRYGLSGTQPLTQREVADRCGISRSYVSRIEKKALQKLADCFEKKTP